MANLLRDAHVTCYENRELIDKSLLCACFHCKQYFPPDRIVSWTDDDETALCPYCDIDAVLGDAGGFELTSAFIDQMYQYWFESEVSDEQESNL